MPIDPGRDWLAAGITGLQRQREWDAVATSEGDGAPGDEVAFVALADLTFVARVRRRLDPAPFARALGESIEPPYRALAVRRSDVWAVGAVAIEVARLDPDPRGGELELSWNGSELALTIDGLPADPSRAVGAGADRRGSGERRVRSARSSRPRGSVGAVGPRALAGALGAVPDARGDRRPEDRRDLRRLALEAPDLAVEDRDERQRARARRRTLIVGRRTSRRSRRSSRRGRAC